MTKSQRKTLDEKWIDKMLDGCPRLHYLKPELLAAIKYGRRSAIEAVKTLDVFALRDEAIDAIRARGKR